MTDTMRRLQHIPGYQYHTSVIALRIQELATRLPHSTRYYSLKANPNPEILAFIASTGLFDAEACSVGELERAVKAGFNPTKIIYGGPGKRTEDIEKAHQLGIIRFSLESLRELLLLQAWEAQHQSSLLQPVKKIIRFKPDIDSTSGISMTAGSSKFGITLQELTALPENTRRQITGIHVYFGSQTPEQTCFIDNVRLVNQQLAQLKLLLPNIDFVNYGGGLAWPYLKDGEQQIQLSPPPDVLPNIETAFEFGRYLVASSGQLITRVLDVKHRDGKQVVLLESGLNHLAGIAATGRLMKSQITLHKYQSISDNTTSTPENPPALVDTAVYGPLCTPADYFDLNTQAPVLIPGDLVYFPNAGAYAYGTRMPDFLLREDIQEEVLHDDIG